MASRAGEERLALLCPGERLLLLGEDGVVIFIEDPADGCGLTGGGALEDQDDHGDHIDGEGESEHGDDWCRFACMARDCALKMNRREGWTTTGLMN